MKKILEICKKIALSSIVCIISVYSYSQNKCEQVVTVKYTPFAGVKVYSVSGSGSKIGIGGSDKRGVIDLGHFSGKDTNKELNIGTVEVTVEMLENNKGGSTDDFQIVNINKLQDYIWKYKYDVTSFIKNGNPTAEIKVDNFKLLRMSNTTDQGIVKFVCTGNHSQHAKYLSYTFDLILKLSSLDKGGMYGFSPQKNNGTNAYVNIRDIVIDQLKGSAESFTSY